jgi:predicted RNA-binding Zn-ribbon protein involved in translation (DUF1610 family)
LNLNPPILSAGELRTHPDQAASALQQLGVLRQTSAATSYACADCGALRAVQIEACGTATRGYISCAECGIVSQVELAVLRRWAIDPIALLAAIFRVNVPAPNVEELARPLWHIGKAGFQGRTKDLLFALGRHRDTDDAALNIVKKRPKSLLFVPIEPDTADWSNDVPNTVIALQSVVGLEGGRFTFDGAFVETVLGGNDAVAPPKRQTRRRAGRMANIEALKNEMIKHIRAAKNHAHDTQDRTGRAQLLQCPTKEEFARLAGVAPYDVTRCFRDEAGSDLNTLWDLAHDLDRLLSYGG